MYTYAFQARDSSGKIIAGVQDALNEENAITSLMSRGLMVLSIQQKSAASKRKKLSTVKDHDVVMATRQLATMVDAGIPLVGALTALYETADPKKQAGLRNVLGDVTGRVQGGESFNGSLAKHPLVFNRLYVSMVKAGEAGGLLAEILDRLAGFLEASTRLKKKIKSAMVYPVAVISIAFLITAFLIMKVVPVFAGIFKDFGKPLPAPTQFLVDLSEFTRGYWWALALILGGVFFGIKAFVKTKQGRELWNRWQAQAPDLRAAGAQDRHEPVFAHLCAAHSLRRADPRSHRDRRRLGRQSRRRNRHHQRRRRRGARRQPFRGDEQEEDLPADDAAHGRRGRIHRQD